MTDSRHRKLRAWDLATLGVLLCFLLLACGPSAATANSWFERRPATSPGSRGFHAQVYDSARKVVVLFGGYSKSTTSDTWQWDGTTWTENKPASSPPARAEHAMAFDSVRNRAVLFGGVASSLAPFGDTWEWDGVTWEQRTMGPPARFGHAMAYDEARARVVLFGGVAGDPTKSGDGAGLSDTWEWDGLSWTKRAPTKSPPGRVHHAMAYDSVRRRVVVFGGVNSAWREPFKVLIDTWEWDGTNWQELTSVGSPQARSHHALTFNTAIGRVVLFGGNVGLPDGPSKLLSDTWEWDGIRWEDRRPATHPAARMVHRMTYDSARQRVVLFGGGVDGRAAWDTWEWVVTP